MLLGYVLLLDNIESNKTGSSAFSHVKSQEISDSDLDLHINLIRGSALGSCKVTE